MEMVDGREKEAWGCVSELEGRFLQGISRSSTVLIGSQIRIYLARYFTLGELLLVVLSAHVLLCVYPWNVPGFNASWTMLRNLMQSVVIQLTVAYVGTDSPDELALLNLLGLLMVSESLPAFRGWLGDDVSSLISTVSFTLSDAVSGILQRSGVPLVGLALGLAFQGRGVFGETMFLTGINSVCNFVFAGISGGELSLAWPVFLLYMVNEVSGHIEQAKAFLDYGFYRSSDAVFASLSNMGVAAHVTAVMFAFLGLALPGDPVWTAVCVLVLVQSSSAWFLEKVRGISDTDPVLAGLCIVTVLHFLCLGVKALCEGHVRQPR